MMGLLCRRERRAVRECAERLSVERRLVHELRSETRQALGERASGGWALAGSFAAGVLVARMGGPIARQLRRLPLWHLGRQLWAHLLV